MAKDKIDQAIKAGKKLIDRAPEIAYDVIEDADEFELDVERTLASRKQWAGQLKKLEAWDLYADQVCDALEKVARAYLDRIMASMLKHIDYEGALRDPKRRFSRAYLDGQAYHAVGSLYKEPHPLCYELIVARTVEKLGLERMTPESREELAKLAAEKKKRIKERGPFVKKRRPLGPMGPEHVQTAGAFSWTTNAPIPYIDGFILCLVLRAHAESRVKDGAKTLVSPATELTAERVEEIYFSFAILRDMAIRDGLKEPEKIYNFWREGWNKRRAQVWINDDANDQKLIDARLHLLSLVGRFSCTGGGD